MPAHDLAHRIRGRDDPDVVVVGAGTAGLAAARHLCAAGLSVTVLEAAQHVGGRMAGEEVDGFRLDQGLHLLNTSLPELSRSLDPGRLELRPLAPGVLVHAGGRRYRVGDPRIPAARLAAVRAPIGSPLDKARLGAALGRLAATPVPQLLRRPELTTAQALAARGLSARVVDGFLRPLLTALLSDPELSTSSRCADLVLRAYARGRLCLPAGGAAAVPRQLAEGLPPGTVRLGVRATAVSADGVETEGHGRVRGRCTVLATDAASAARLLPGLHLPGFHPVTTYYHVAPEAPLAEPLLLLDADRASPVSHSLVLSRVDPSYAPPGRSLVATAVLGRRSFDAGGPAALEPRVRRRLSELYGTSTAAWAFLAVRHVEQAVPAMPPPHHFGRPVRVIGGLYVCGDHRDTSSVQGALVSGRRAARQILRDLGAPALVREAAAA
ncbi:NAD(P)/FAD-dependent oxidoreductase [Streptacidiphilus sp. ASG 303]|uniref:NAD(P)/FAD-dependent oxidoreductase n=1 Tax=Streptomycetaceae TaxID=2062 RepID=UPI001E2931AA|nr:NAD(P)/FAD-dependent oxidoreductase [Streptacidiphilus sp. ASG 303]MCD0481728.1 FAD-dependent oxidoreductase [Streptacidiphilus sp. ASG 303]